MTLYISLSLSSLSLSLSLFPAHTYTNTHKSLTFCAQFIIGYRTLLRYGRLQQARKNIKVTGTLSHTSWDNQNTQTLLKVSLLVMT